MYFVINNHSNKTNMDGKAKESAFINAFVSLEKAINTGDIYSVKKANARLIKALANVAAKNLKTNFLKDNNK